MSGNHCRSNRALAAARGPIFGLQRDRRKAFVKTEQHPATASS
ncbi:hypothetical protein [Piscinibacter sp.]|nr:hypothetical protein [Albitalea sp.]HUG26577.1 hypothetical protein [Albitalea sp.]